MGKIHLFNREQKIILDEVKKSEFLSTNFYFTGGTALSVYYLGHRYSDDLDFFSYKKFDNQVIFSLVEKWSKKYNFTFESRFVEVVYIFTLFFKNKTNLKLDFSYYPYKQLEKPVLVDNMPVDSLTDIAVNKLLTISQRSDVKDFVDLYYLLQQFSVWELKEGIRIKFNMEIEPLLLAADLLKVEDFDYLPRMVKSLKLDELKAYFRQKAKEIGKKSLK